MTMTYDFEQIALTIPCASGQDFVVPAWAFTVDHLPGWKFAVHKSPTSKNVWHAAEVTTGMEILGLQKGRTLRGAYELAVGRLGQVTPQMMEKSAARGHEELKLRATQIAAA